MRKLVGAAGIGARGAASILLVILLAGCVGFLAVAGLVRQHVLDPETYGRALVSNRAFDRVYTEALADPALDETAAEMLGSLDVDPALAPHATATTTNALRWALPPDRLQVAVDAVIDDALAYLAGDAEEFRPTIELSDVLERIDDAAVTLTRTLLAEANIHEVETLAEFRTEVDALVSDLERGRIPRSLPILVGDHPPEAMAEVIVDATEGVIDPEVHTGIVASFAAGDGAEALIASVSETVRPYVERRVEILEERGTNGHFDVIGEATDHARDKVGRVEVNMAVARDVVALTGPIPVAFVAALAVGAIVALAWLNRGHRSRLALLLAAAMGGGGLLVLAVGRVLSDRLAHPLGVATGTGPGTWNLPDGIRSVLTDVTDTVGADLRSNIVGIAAALGLLALATVAATGGAALMRRLLDDPDPSEAGRPPWRRRAPIATAGALSVAFVLAGGLLSTRSVSADAEPACNGHAELCDRRYDEVAYAATHNSMSSPDVVQVWPQHDGDIPAQLEAGIRALLIDTHHWRRADSAADLAESVEDESLDLPEPVVRAVLDTAGERAEARPGVFLCHNECVFGGRPFVDALSEIRTFLEDNPREVVTLIIQDGVGVDETEEAFSDAGLDDFLYDHSDRWPTLGEMIDSGERLVVFAEKRGGDPPWYAAAWEAIQDTPYDVTSPEGLDCSPNRGDADASLFLLNHWVNRLTPSRTDATVVNAAEFIVDRAERCSRERGAMANFVAVDFYNIGDVVGAVDHLNGVSPP